MKTNLFILLILISSGKTFSTEKSTKKELKWQLQIQYARLYNYRYARLPDFVLEDSINPNFPSKVAYLDTGHIATYTNLIGLLVQRKIWKIINLKTGLTLSRRGYLGTYVKYPNHYEIQLIPRKVIFLPFIINLNFKVRKKILLEFGFGTERSIYFLKEKVYWPTTLEKSSRGFFGYQWDKSRKLDPKTKIEIHDFGFAGINYLLTTSISYQLNNKFFVSLNGNYSIRPKHYKVDSSNGDPALNTPNIYETKPYILGLGASLAYSF